jgi:hypothetical protein
VSLRIGTTPDPLSLSAPHLALSLARETQIDPDLALLVKRWDALPEALRAGIVAMVKAVQPR